MQHVATRCNTWKRGLGGQRLRDLTPQCSQPKGMIVAMVWCHSVRMKRRRDWAHRCHICRAWAHSFHIFTKTGLTAATSALGVGSPPSHLHQDWSGKRGDVRRGCSVNDGAPTCILHVSSCMLRVAYCVLSAVCRLLHCCTVALLSVACCVLHVVCCLLRVVRCVLHIEYSVLHGRAVRCMPLQSPTGSPDDDDEYSRGTHACSP